MEPHRRDHLAGHLIVWIAQVSTSQDSLIFLEPYLDSRDRERAARFRFSGDRARFVLGRGLLRKCLGHYLQQTPETSEEHSHGYVTSERRSQKAKEPRPEGLR